MWGAPLLYLVPTVGGVLRADTYCLASLLIRSEWMRTLQILRSWFRISARPLKIRKLDDSGFKKKDEKTVLTVRTNCNV